jgi:plasmid stabilization system protein ParE
VIVEILPRARQRIIVVARWWRKNRADAPTLFDDELADLIARLERHPVLGTVHEILDGATILKARLRKTEQAVYYSVDEAKGVISIHTVWGARRGRKPKL